MAVGEISNLKLILVKLLKELNRNFIKPKKSFKVLNQCDYLIYDGEAVDTLKYCFPALEQSEVLRTRGEEVNIWILILSILNLKNLRNPVFSYQIKYIKKVRPKFLLTHIDNNSLFYKIADACPEVKSVMMQNGTRDDFLSRIENRNKLSVDYTLVHNKSIGKYFESKLKTEVLVVGSIRNNAIPRTVSSIENRVVYISTYLDIEIMANKYLDLPGGMVSVKDFLEIEGKVFQILERWCKNKSIDLVVAGVMESDDASHRERKFFSSLVGAETWQYKKRAEINSTYDLIDTSEMVVTVDSTMGYEALARGKKTALLSVRAKNIQHTDRLIGFPEIIKEEPPFWTQDPDMSNCEKVLDFVWEADMQDWIRITMNTTPKLMEFDRDNSTLRSLLNLTEAKSRPNIE